MILRTHGQVFFGQTRKGKSELCRAFWISQAPWRVCIDVKDDLGDKLPGVPTVHEPSEILHYPTVRIVPPDPTDEAWFNEVYRIAFEEGNCLLWCDELNTFTHPNKCPKWTRIYILQGQSPAHLCGHLGCSPRPADIHPIFASQANHIFVFFIKHDLDRKACARHLGIPLRELDAMLDGDASRLALPPWHFIHRDEEQQIHVCEPGPDPDELTALIRTRYFGPAA